MVADGRWSPSRHEAFSPRPLRQRPRTTSHIVAAPADVDRRQQDRPRGAADRLHVRARMREVASPRPCGRPSVISLRHDVAVRTVVRASIRRECGSSRRIGGRRRVKRLIAVGEQSFSVRTCSREPSLWSRPSLASSMRGEFFVRGQPSSKRGLLPRPLHPRPRRPFLPSCPRPRTTSNSPSTSRTTPSPAGAAAAASRRSRASSAAGSRRPGTRGRGAARGRGSGARAGGWGR